MTRCVVDTNVPIVANGRDGDYSPACKLACIQALRELKDRGVVVVDAARKVLAEYRHLLREDGQPGVGDLFFRHILVNIANPQRVEPIALTTVQDGIYQDFPTDAALAAFDQSDRLFAALARVSGAPVLNAVDSDWYHHKAALARNGIEVRFLCGDGHFKGRS